MLGREISTLDPLQFLMGLFSAYTGTYFSAPKIQLQAEYEMMLYTDVHLINRTILS